MPWKKKSNPEIPGFLPEAAKVCAWTAGDPMNRRIHSISIFCVARVLTGADLEGLRVVLGLRERARLTGWDRSYFGALGLRRW